MSTTYPTTITDKTGRVWEWSDQWGGYRHPGQLTHGYDTIRDQWGIATIVPEIGAQYTLGGGSTVYTVASVNENMAMLTWTKPGDIGIRNRYLAAVEFGRLVPVPEPTIDTTGAYLEPHAYDSFPKPLPFWIVRCDHPSHGPIALNSGHHYRENVKHHAEALAAEHNAEHERDRAEDAAELREREAIQADAENERDGYRD